MGKVPGFFKVYFPSSSSERMAFPLVYSKVFIGAKHGDAYLRNSGGQLCPVRITKDGYSWFFQDGWKELLEKIDVEAGDLFVFDYAGNSIFDFKLLGRDGCSKDTSWTEIEEEENEEAGEEDK